MKLHSIRPATHFEAPAMAVSVWRHKTRRLAVNHDPRAVLRGHDVSTTKVHERIKAMLVCIRRSR